MNKVIFVSFDSEQKAYEGERALHDMHRDGTITLYDDAVVAKDPGGKLLVRERPGEGPVGTLGGMLTGGLIGLLGGPIGAAIGLGTGTLVGAAFDVTRAGLAGDFVETMAARLKPGTAAVIAEIDEDWEAPLDARMETVGGTLLRQTPVQIEDAFFERELEAAQKELASLEAERLSEVQKSVVEKSQKKAARLQAKVDAAKRKVRAKEDKLAAKMQSVKDEENEKIAALEAQKATAIRESSSLLERRQAEVRSDYERRIQRLRDALDRRKAVHESSPA